MVSKYSPVGEHALIDIDGAKRLDEPAWLEEVMRAAADAAGATIIGSHFHHFGEAQGVTGILLLAESHISVHTWPECDFAAFDIFMCGAASTQVAVEAISNCFAGSRINLRCETRGTPRG